MISREKNDNPRPSYSNIKHNTEAAKPLPYIFGPTNLPVSLISAQVVSNGNDRVQLRDSQKISI